jgi:prophage regulatory protein
MALRFGGAQQQAEQRHDGKRELDNNNTRRLLADPCRCYRAKALAQLLGIHEITLWGWVRKGKIPRPKKLAPRVTVWLASDIQEWLASK